MKIKNKTNDTTHFKPLTLEITIETIEEFATIYAMANSSFDDLKKNVSHDFKPLKDISDDAKNDLYNALREIAEKRELK